MEDFVASEISSVCAMGAVYEPATKGGEDVVRGSLLNLLGGAAKAPGAGRERKQNVVVWRATDRAPKYGVGQHKTKRVK